MNPTEIIDRFYSPGLLRDLLIAHSEAVAEKALDIWRHGSFPDVDPQFLYEAAMLHDIGIFRCNAPSIHCHGKLPYICHGTEGADLLRAIGLPRHALVCERHTGAGMTRDEIIANHIPVPERDMLPLSTEERIICYADKLFSKSAADPRHAKSPEEARRSLERFGSQVLARFDALHDEFESMFTFNTN